MWAVLPYTFLEAYSYNKRINVIEHYLHLYNSKNNFLFNENW